MYPNFKMPTPSSISSGSIWSIIEEHLPECRNVSHTKSIAKGIEAGRIRLITPESACAPTLTKCQNRQTKDSVCILHNKEYYLPTERLLKRLNGIPDSMNFNSVSATIASELVGQSIEYPMHEQLIKSLKEHIAINTNQTINNKRLNA